MERIELVQRIRYREGVEFDYEDLKDMDYCMMEVFSGDTTKLIDIALYSYGEEHTQTVNKGRSVLRLYGGRVWLPFIDYIKAKMKRHGIDPSIIVDNYETNWFFSIFRDSWVDLDLEMIKRYIIYTDESMDMLKYEDFWGNPK